MNIMAVIAKSLKKMILWRTTGVRGVRRLAIRSFSLKKNQGEEMLDELRPLSMTSDTGAWFCAKPVQYRRGVPPAIIEAWLRRSFERCREPGFDCPEIR
ncbi:hypothetical protein JOE11_003674 [Robbsia andropogonis]|uniref:hypothetical protein n=1 Tax=Robbsia andropogonis TaxID=28092 RepID=UPI003D2170A1